MGFRSLLETIHAMPTLVVGMISRELTCPRQAWAWHPNSLSRVFDGLSDKPPHHHRGGLALRGDVRLMKLAPGRASPSRTAAIGHSGSGVV